MRPLDAGAGLCGQPTVCAPGHSIHDAAVRCAQRHAIVAVGEEDAAVMISRHNAAVDFRIVGCSHRSAAIVCSARSRLPRVHPPRFTAAALALWTSNHSPRLSLTASGSISSSVSRRRGTEVGAPVGVDVWVVVAVGDGVTVAVGDGASVAVGAPVAVCIGALVFVGDGVSVAFGISANGADGVAVMVAEGASAVVGDGELVAVAVAVGELVAVAVGDGVAVGLGCGACGAPGLPRSPLEPGQACQAITHSARSPKFVRSRLAPGWIVRPLSALHATASARLPSGARSATLSSPLARKMLL